MPSIWSVIFTSCISVAPFKAPAVMRSWNVQELSILSLIYIVVSVLITRYVAFFLFLLFFLLASLPFSLIKVHVIYRNLCVNSIKFS